MEMEKLPAWLRKILEVLSLIRKFVLNFFWFGFAALLITIIFDFTLTNQTFIQKVIIELGKNVSIAIIIAAIFTWASESRAFINNVKTLLKNIIISRDFLSNLDTKNKMETLGLIIKPTGYEKEIYSNIEGYYDYYIRRTMDIINKNVRSDYSVNSRIYFDKKKGVLACEEVISYRLYPNSTGFGMLRLGFRESEKLNEVKYVKIYIPEGGRIDIPEKQIKLSNVAFGGGKARMAEINLEDYARDQKHLKIELKMIEYGCDHWIPVPYQALQPTDGLNYYLRCEDDIYIKKIETFGQGINFNIDENESHNECSITTYQWINDGTGIFIIASMREC